VSTFNRYSKFTQSIHIFHLRSNKFYIFSDLKQTSTHNLKFHLLLSTDGTFIFTRGSWAASSGTPHSHCPSGTGTMLREGPSRPRSWTRARSCITQIGTTSTASTTRYYSKSLVLPNDFGLNDIRFFQTFRQETFPIPVKICMQRYA
jgi:hypothetical protein